MVSGWAMGRNPDWREGGADTLRALGLRPAESRDVGSFWYKRNVVERN